MRDGAGSNIMGAIVGPIGATAEVAACVSALLGGELTQVEALPPICLALVRQYPLYTDITPFWC